MNLVRWNADQLHYRRPSIDTSGSRPEANVHEVPAGILAFPRANRVETFCGHTPYEVIADSVL